MVNEQHAMIVTKGRFLTFRQLRVRDFETSERFLLYGKPANNCHLFHQTATTEKVDIFCKIHC